MPHDTARAPVRVAALQMVSTPSVEENLAAAAELIARAAAGGARLVALPEYFCFMGQGESDKVAIRETDGAGPIQNFLADQARRHGLWLVGGTLPLASPDPMRVYNSTLVHDPDGARQARYDKIHLGGYRHGDEAYDESRSTRQGTALAVLPVAGLQAGLSVGHDVRFPELYRALGPVDLIMVPAAFTYSVGRAHWELLLRARAVENQCYVLAPAQGGQHPTGACTWGHTLLVDPWGEMVEVLTTGPGVVSGVLDPARIAEVRTALPALSRRVM